MSLDLAHVRPSHAVMYLVERSLDSQNGYVQRRLLHHERHARGFVRNDREGTLIASFVVVTFDFGANAHYSAILS